LVSCTDGDGYLALFQLVRMVHPALGQATAQREQPSQLRSQSFEAHISRFMDYYQSEECSGRFYSENEKVISIISRLHPTWRDTIKRKYSNMVPQCGTVSTIPSECSIPLLCVTLEQWCDEDRFDLPWVKTDTATSRVFELANDSAFLPSGEPPIPSQDASVFHIGYTALDMATVDRALEHVICYVDRKTKNGTYPKCVACGLPGHSIGQCHPLINFCLAGALASHHPDIVRKIQATYKNFPRAARGRPSRPPTVKQLVAALDLPPSVLNSDEVPVDSASIEHLASPDLDAPHMYHGQTGTAVVTFHDHTDVAGPPEPVATPFTVSPSGAPMFLLYQEPETADHAVTVVSAMQSVIVDSGSTLNTVGDPSLLRNYESPSPSPIKMCSATGHIICPRGQGVLLFQFNDGTGSLTIQCQHTPDIASSIFSRAETCERLDYDTYTLSCDRTSLQSSVTFTKPGKPDIRISGTYVNRLPLIPLSALPSHPVLAVAPCRSISVDTAALASAPLSGDLDQAMHQVYQVCTRLEHHVSMVDCRSSVLHAIHDDIANDMTHGGTMPFPVLHVTDAVNRTLWHLRTCHPNPDRLIKLSKISKGMPNIRQPQQIEKCSDCLIAKM
jgi:hypothetical protein